MTNQEQRRHRDKHITTEQIRQAIIDEFLKDSNPTETPKAKDSLTQIDLHDVHEQFPPEDKPTANINDYLNINRSGALLIFAKTPQSGSQPTMYYIVHIFKDREGRKVVIVPTAPQHLIRMGTQKIQSKAYATALLWNFHGAPCQRLSRTHGGDGYPTITL